jgi:hypothetical protein
MIAYTPRNENGFASRFPELVGIEELLLPVSRMLPYATGESRICGNNQTIRLIQVTDIFRFWFGC